MLFIICSVLMVARATALATGVFVGNARLTYSSSAGHGACGPLVNHHQGMSVGVAPNYWTHSNPNQDPICKQCIDVTYNGQTLNLPVNDKYMGGKANELMLSEPAFRKLAKSSYPWELNGASWKFAECYVEPATTAAPPTEKPIAFDGNGNFGWFASTSKAGACGTAVNATSDLIVGVGEMYFSQINPNGDPICNKCIEASYMKNTIKLKIQDKCAGCQVDTILLSEPAMMKVTGRPKLHLDNVSGASWKIVPC